MIAFRSHLDTHVVKKQRIGAGLVREACWDCRHVSVHEDTEHPSEVSSEVPEWMRQAADRFAATAV